MVYKLILYVQEVVPIPYIVSYNIKWVTIFWHMVSFLPTFIFFFTLDSGMIRIRWKKNRIHTTAAEMIHNFKETQIP